MTHTPSHGHAPHMTSPPPPQKPAFFLRGEGFAVWSPHLAPACPGLLQLLLVRVQSTKETQHPDDLTANTSGLLSLQQIEKDIQEV